MNAACAQIPHFNRVVVMNLLLDTEVPLDRIRQHLIRNEAGRRSPGVPLAQVAARRKHTGFQTAFRQEGRGKGRWEVARIDSRTELRRIGGASNVIKYHVLSHPEACSDRCCSLVSRRIGKTDTGSEVL